MKQKCLCDEDGGNETEDMSWRTLQRAQETVDGW